MDLFKEAKGIKDFVSSCVCVSVLFENVPDSYQDTRKIDNLEKEVKDIKPHIIAELRVK